MLEIRGITKSYGKFALNDINLNIKRGEYYVLLGRSGSGKSQLLELISGLRSPDKGELILDGENITDCRIQSREIGLVFQDFALFPHLSVGENIAYPLKMNGIPKEKIENSVISIAESVNITHILHRKPALLSGGEKQRVAVARTLVRSPKIILLDEPMSSIDTPLRDDLRRLLRKINVDGMTILHVTHDYREAIRLADRIGVIHNGRIIQQGTPENVFNNPVNRFVARFAGIQNFFKVKIEQESDRALASSHEGYIFSLGPGNYPADGILMIRSGDLKISLDDPGCKINCARGVITEINRAEFGYEAFIDTGETFYATFTEEVLRDLKLEKGKTVFVSFKAEDIKVM